MMHVARDKISMAVYDKQETKTLVRVVPHTSCYTRGTAVPVLLSICTHHTYPCTAESHLQYFVSVRRK